MNGIITELNNTIKLISDLVVEHLFHFKIVPLYFFGISKVLNLNQFSYSLLKVYIPHVNFERNDLVLTLYKGIINKSALDCTSNL